MDARMHLRVAAAVWRERARAARRQARRSKHTLTSAALIIAGMAGILGFASLIGLWCLGLAGMAESAGVLWFGLMRDDGISLPRSGERTVAEILQAGRRGP